MQELEIRRGDLVRYGGRTWKVRNVRTDRHRDGVYTTAKISRKNETMFCVPVSRLELIRRGGEEA